MNHKHYDYASTALTLVNVTNTTRLYGGEEEKEILVFVYAFFVCGGDFSLSFNVKNTRASSFYHCFTNLRTHNCRFIYTRFDVLGKKGEARRAEAVIEVTEAKRRERLYCRIH